MKCKLLDFACHAQSALWQWWDGLGWGLQLLIGAGLVLMILGALGGLLSLLRSIGGWPAVAGAVAVVIGVVLAILPRKPEPDDEFVGDVKGDDAKGPFQFGVERKKRERGKRRFDPSIGDSGAWQRLNPISRKWEAE